MFRTIKTIASFCRDSRGVTALEYGLIAAAVVAIGLAGFSVIGDDVQGKFQNVIGAMGSAEPAAATPATPDSGG